MRLTHFISVCLVCFPIGTNQTFCQPSTLQGTIINPIEKKVYTTYLDDILKEYALKTEYDLDSENKFLFNYNFKNPSMIELQYGNNRRKIYIEPGDKINIKFDGNNFHSSWEISGRGSCNNIFLENLNKLYPIYKRYQFTSTDLEHHFNSIDSLLIDIQSFINIESEKYNLSNKFLEYIHSDILYQAAINKIFYIQKNYTMSGNIDENTGNYLKFMDKITLNSDNNLYVESFPKLIFMYIDCIYQIENQELIFKLRTTNVPLLPESERVSLFKNIAKIKHETAKKLFHGRTLDYFTSKELIRLFNDGWIEPFDKIYKDYKYEGFLTEYTRLIDDALENASRLRLGKPAPNFGLYDLNNNEISLYDMKGKVILLNFWSSWCKPCMESIPKLKSIQSHFSNEDINIVNICLDENARTGKLYIEKERLTGLHLFSTGFGSQTARDYSIQSIPRYFLLDRDGNIVDKIKGTFNEKTLIKKIDELL